MRQARGTDSSPPNGRGQQFWDPWRSTSCRWLGLAIESTGCARRLLARSRARLPMPLPWLLALGGASHRSALIQRFSAPVGQARVRPKQETGQRTDGYIDGYRRLCRRWSVDPRNCC